MCLITHRNSGTQSMKSVGPNLAVAPDGGLPQVLICDCMTVCWIPFKLFLSVGAKYMRALNETGWFGKIVHELVRKSRVVTVVQC